MSKTFTLAEVNALELSAAENATILERERIINLLIDLKAIRRDAFGDLVAFNISGDEVIYLTGLEKEE